MTTDELERDLKTLAERRPHDEHLRLAIRATLSEQLRPRPKSRRRNRLARVACKAGVFARDDDVGAVSSQRVSL